MIALRCYRARRRIAQAAVTLSSAIPTSNPHAVKAGAGAAMLAHVPSFPGRLHFSSTPVQALPQQTASTQKPVLHCAEVEQAPPCGTGVLVGVAVDVTVGVLVGVSVRVAVAVELAVPVVVAVAVGVLLGVSVTVAVAVWVGVAVAVSVAVLVAVAVAVAVAVLVAVAVFVEGAGV